MMITCNEKQPPSPPSRRASDPTPLCCGAVSKKVCFNEDVTLIRVTALRDMSEEERAAVWYTDDDFAEIRSDMRRTARLIHRLPRSLLGSSSTRRRFSANDADDMEICARGLEHLASREVLKRLQDEQRTVKDAVLTLQSNPMVNVNNSPADSSEDDDDNNAPRNNSRLAIGYSNVIRIANERAFRAALADAEEATNYLRVST